MLPTFSSDGRYLATFSEHHFVHLIDAFQEVVDPLPVRIPVSIESTVMAIALYDEQTLAVILARDFSDGKDLISDKLTRTRNAIDMIIMSLSLPPSAAEDGNMVRSCYASDGKCLFVIFIMPAKLRIRISNYDINSREKISSVVIETGKTFIECRIFGSVYIDDAESIVVGLSFKPQIRRKFQLPWRTEDISKHKILIVSPKGDITTALDENGPNQVPRITVSQRKLMFLQWNTLKYLVHVLEWDIEEKAFTLRGEIEGNGRWIENEALVGIAVSGDRLTLLTRDARFSFRNVRTIKYVDRVTYSYICYKNYAEYRYKFSPLPFHEPSHHYLGPKSRPEFWNNAKNPKLISEQLNSIIAYLNP